MPVPGFIIQKQYGIIRVMSRSPMTSFDAETDFEPTVDNIIMSLVWVRILAFNSTFEVFEFRPQQMIDTHVPLILFVIRLGIH